MAKHGAFHGQIVINGVDLSDHCTNFDAPGGRNDIPANAMGDDSEYGLPGLKTGSLTAVFLQDFVAGSVHKTLSPLYENSTIFPVVWRAKQEAAGSENPEYSMDAYIQEYRSIGGERGEGLICNVTFRPAGTVVNTV